MAGMGVPRAGGGEVLRGRQLGGELVLCLGQELDQ